MTFLLKKTHPYKILLFFLPERACYNKSIKIGKAAE